MTFQYSRDPKQRGRNDTLFRGPANWVSPNPDAAGHDYRTNPPPATGAKVILADTDHLWGIGGDVAWVWKSFLRGLNPIFMDPYREAVLRGGREAQWEAVRRAMGVTRRLSLEVDLATLTPEDQLASPGWCLAAWLRVPRVCARRPGGQRGPDKRSGRLANRLDPSGRGLGGSSGYHGHWRHAADVQIPFRQATPSCISNGDRRAPPLERHPASPSSPDREDGPHTHPPTGRAGEPAGVWGSGLGMRAQVRRRPERHQDPARICSPYSLAWTASR